MQKITRYAYVMLILIIATVVFTACGGNDEAHDKLTIEEMGATIVAAGSFWEEWWSLTGRFDYHQHFVEFDWEPLPEYLCERGLSFGMLLPSSGFAGINCIRDYLLKYYTEAWVDAELFHAASPFVEYKDTMFVDITRVGSVRPNWETATHTLIEQNGGHAVVETTVLWGGWHRLAPGDDIENAFPREVTHRFIFADGKIDSPGRLELHQDAIIM